MTTEIRPEKVMRTSQKTHGLSKSPSARISRRSPRIIAPTYGAERGLTGDAGERERQGKPTTYARRVSHRLATIEGEWGLLAERFDRHLKAANRSDGTRDQYAEAVQRLAIFIDEAGMPGEPDQLTSEHLEQYFIELRRTVAANTVSLRFRALRVFFRWALAERYVPRNPIDGLRAPRPVVVAKPVYTLANVQEMISDCGTDFTGRRDRAIIALLFDCGLRASELLALQLEDVKGDVVVVRAPKGLRQREVGMGRDCDLAVARYVKARRKISASGALWTSTVGRPIAMAGLRALLRRHGASGVHIFRHSSATAARDFMDPLDMLKSFGWSSMSMLDRYTATTATRRAIESKRRRSPGDGLNV